MSARQRQHKKRIAMMRESAKLADALLAAYDAVIEDLGDTLHHCARADLHRMLNDRRSRLAADIRRLRGEIATMEASAPL